MNKLKTVSREQYTKFLLANKALRDTPIEGYSLCIMQAHDATGKVCAQATYFRGGHRVYQIREN